ncbi:FAD-dependent monooxygenase [Robiginitomaculum antarcticum]|uniref:FAD-dependent monooxygenase n=1 Tax=Robiginitomaculum antarcticum TaxID=437507 RepID=UPI00035D9695|nr:FAD-dependent monooxygenase [Robiginitomaculum antarcticum]
MGSPPHILIAGGGIGGLTAAIALARHGARVSLFERASEFGEIGAGLQLSPNAMAVLYAFGLGDEIKAAAFEPEAGILRDYLTGKPLLTTKMRGAYEARYGHGYYNIHRADLHDILVKAARDSGVALHLDHDAQGYAQRSDFISLQTSQGEYSGDALVGADGIKSAIRAKMLGHSEPRYTGFCAWRGTVATNALPEGTLPKAANNWLGPDKHFVAYYLRGGELVNFVAIHKREAWSDEYWTQDADMTELRAAYQDWDAPVCDILNACKQSYLWGLSDHPALPNWTDGRAALLGDAAHPMLPFMAQGAAMAIEDAWVLASKVLSRDAPMAFRLRAYQAARYQRATMVQDISRNNAKLYHAHDAIGLAKRAVMLKTASLFPAAAHSKFDPVFGVDVTKSHPICQV